LGLKQIDNPSTMAGGAAGGALVTASFAAQMNSKPNAMTFVSITVVMMGALMFGIDQNNFGLITGKPSFGQFWCPKFNFEEEKADPTFCERVGMMNVMLQPPSWSLFNNFGLVMVAVGMAFGAFTLGRLLVGRFGRRLAISVGCLTCFCGTIVVSFLSNNVTVYMIGRFITGYGCGIACYCLPMYQSEVATPGIRGVTGALFQFMVALGGLLTAVLLSDHFIQDWRQGFMLPGYAGLLVGVGVWLCPESPRFVIGRFGKEAARPVLQRVRQGDIEVELDFLVQNLEAEKQSGSVSFRELFTTPGLNRRVFTACYLMIAQQFTGINAFIGFQDDIFVAAGADPLAIHSIPGPAFMFQLAMTIGCVTGLLLVDSSVGGRRKQLNAAAAFMVPALVIGAVAGWAKWNSQVSQVSLYVYGFGFQLAWGIIPWFYPAEIFTMREREAALSLSNVCNFVTSIVVVLICKPLLRRSASGTFLTFAVLNFTNVVFVLACVKETKGVPLEDVPGLFGAHDLKDSKKERLSSV
jgi:sugar porter (SP) family MFS transporter